MENVKIWKSYIILHMGSKLFENIKTIENFYFQVSMLCGDKMKYKDDTLIFIDLIHAYPHLLQLLKFLVRDNRYTHVVCGSLYYLSNINSYSKYS